jgi:predicted nucleotidyltransferase
MSTINREEEITVLKSNRTTIKRFSVKSLALFGSAARNRLRKNSDVDVLVQFEQTTWANYIVSSQ